MAKTKTKLKLIDDLPSGKPTRQLGVHGLRLWTDVLGEFVISDSAGLEMLEQCCSAVDRAEARRESIDLDGECLRSSGGIRVNPLLGAELQTRAFICRTLDRLGCGSEFLKVPGRPPGFHPRPVQ